MANPCDERPEYPEQLSPQNPSFSPAPPPAPPRLPSPDPIILFPRRSVSAGDITADRLGCLIPYELVLTLPPSSPAATPSLTDIWDASNFSAAKNQLISSGQLDPFRAATLSVWSFDGANLTFIDYGSEEVRSQYNIPIKTEIMEEDTYSNLESMTKIKVSLDKNIVNRTIPNFNSQYSNGEKFLSIFVEGEESHLYETGRDSQFQGGLLKKDKVFVDSTFSSPLPFFRDEVQNMSIPVFNYADIQINTTYLTQERPDTSEYETVSLYRKYLSLKGDTGLGPPQSRQEMIVEEDKIQKFPSNKIASFEEANTELGSEFSNYVDITINTGQNNPISEFLNNNNMDRHLLDFISDPSNRSSDDKKYTQILDETIIGRDPSDPTGNDRFSNFIGVHTFPGFVEKISTISRGNHESPPSEYPLHYNGSGNYSMLRFDDAIMSQIFLEQLNRYVEDNQYSRTFSDILQGKKAHSEVVAYKVIKKTRQGKEIQTFYFSDSNEVLSINFRDTQIVSGREYLYEIYAINMVLASNVSYSQLKTGETITDSSGRPISTIVQDTSQGYNNDMARRIEQDLEGLLEESDLSAARRVSSVYGTPPTRQANISEEESASIMVSTGLNVLIFETPFFKKEISIYDHPPAYPEISFLPYQGIEDKLSIMFRANTTTLEELPIPILSSDPAQIIRMSNAQGIRRERPLIYKSDSLPEYYEMFVLDFHPSSYSDFSEAQYVKVPTSGKAAIATFEVTPNKNFYYIFRSADKSGISNPTEVFRANMVSYENGIFLDMEVVEMIKKTLDNEILFERILSVRPNAIQRSINFLENDVTEESFMSTAPAAGTFSAGNANEDNSLWGKRFKIRLKSKVTGRAIDINIKYTDEIRISKKISSPQSSQTDVSPGAPTRLASDNPVSVLSKITADDNQSSALKRSTTLTNLPTSY